MVGITIKGLRKKYPFLKELTDDEIVMFKKGEKYQTNELFKNIIDLEEKYRFNIKIGK